MHIRISNPRLSATLGITANQWVVFNRFAMTRLRNAIKRQLRYRQDLSSIKVDMKKTATSQVVVRYLNRDTGYWVKDTPSVSQGFRRKKNAKKAKVKRRQKIQRAKVRIQIRKTAVTRRKNKARRKLRTFVSTEVRRKKLFAQWTSIHREKRSYVDMDGDASAPLIMVKIKLTYYEAFKRKDIDTGEEITDTLRTARWQKKLAQVNFIKEGFVNVAVRTRKPISQWKDDLVEFIIREQNALDGKYISHKRISEAYLSRMKMQGIQLKDRFLEKVGQREIIQRQKQCVADFMVAELRGRRVEGCLKLTTTLVTKQLEIIQRENGIEVGSGFCTETIFKYFEKRNLRISCYALDPSMRVFTKYIHKDATIAIAFVVKDKHLFPITSDHIINSLKQTGRVIQQRSDIRWYPENISEVLRITPDSDDSHLLVKFFRGELPKNKRVILIDPSHFMDTGSDNIERKYRGYNGEGPHVNIQDLASTCMHECGYYVSQFKPQFTGFMHPLTGQVMVSDEDFERRVECMRLMKQEFGKDMQNLSVPQSSWAMLGKTFVDMNEGRIPKSQYSNAHMHIIDNYNSRPLSATYINEHTWNDDCRGWDFNKQYTNCILDNEFPYSVFQLDAPVKYDGHDIREVGEYLCEPFSTKHGALFTRQTLIGGLVKYLVDAGHLSKSKIVAYIKPTKFISKDTLKGSVRKMIEMFPNDYKRPVNMVIGLYGKRYNKAEKSMCTTTEESAMLQWVEGMKAGMRCSFSEANGLFFVNQKKEERIQGGDHSSIWRHIVCNGILKMCRMLDQYMDDNSKLISIKTDAFYIENPAILDTLPGLKEETKVRLPTYRPLDRREPFDLDKVCPHLEWTEATADEAVNMESFCCTGPPGSGKTTLLMKVQPPEKNIPIFSLTWSSTQNLREKGATQCTVFGRQFKWNDVRLVKYVEKCKQQGVSPVVMVDEFSMPDMKIMTQLYIATRVFGLKLQLYGDHNQCMPVGNHIPRVIDRKVVSIDKNGRTDRRCTRVYDYMKCQWFREMCGNVRVTLKWHKNARYDEAMNTELEHLLRTGTLSDHWKKVKFHKGLVNIVSTNRYRRKCIDKYDPEFRVGQRVIAIDNHIKSDVYNAEFKQCTGVSAGKIQIGEHWLPKRSFQSGAYVTVHKYQGQTIEGHFQIHEAFRMTKNQLYTAISRGTRLDHVHLKHCTKVFKSPVPHTEPWEVPLMKGKIGGLYMATNEIHAYIGQVKDNERMPKRWQEHCESDKVPMDMSWDWKSLGRFLYFSDYELNKAEQRAIIYEDLGSRTLVNKQHRKLREMKEYEPEANKINLLEEQMTFNVTQTNGRYMVVHKLGNSRLGRAEYRGKKAQVKVDKWVSRRKSKGVLAYL